MRTGRLEVTAVAYADDVVLLAEKLRFLEEALGAVIRGAAKVGIKLMTIGQSHAYVEAIRRDMISLLTSTESEWNVFLICAK